MNVIDRILMSLAVAVVIGLTVYGTAILLMLADRVLPITVLGLVIAVIFLGLLIVDVMTEE